VTGGLRVCSLCLWGVDGGSVKGPAGGLASEELADFTQSPPAH
jgi:hypothetical protein